MSELQGLFFWGFLLAFGVVMYLIVASSKDEAGFFLPLALPRYRPASSGGDA
jgi:hypothetical protein